MPKDRVTRPHLLPKGGKLGTVKVPRSGAGPGRSVRCPLRSSVRVRSVSTEGVESLGSRVPDPDEGSTGSSRTEWRTVDPCPGPRV